MEDELIEQANRDDDADQKQLPTIEELKDGASIIDPNDAHYQEYMSRKQTLMKNVETIASMKFEKNNKNY